MIKVESGMSRDDLLHLLVTGEQCWWRDSTSNDLRVVGLKPESGGKDIHHWLVNVRDGDNRRVIYVKTV